MSHILKLVLWLSPVFIAPSVYAIFCIFFGLMKTPFYIPATVLLVLFNTGWGGYVGAKSSLWNFST